VLRCAGVLQWSPERSFNGNGVTQDSECDELVQRTTARHGTRHVTGFFRHSTHLLECLSHGYVSASCTHCVCAMIVAAADANVDHSDS